MRTRRKNRPASILDEHRRSLRGQRRPRRPQLPSRNCHKQEQSSVPSLTRLKTIACAASLTDQNKPRLAVRSTEHEERIREVSRVVDHRVKRDRDTILLVFRQMQDRCSASFRERNGRPIFSANNRERAIPSSKPNTAKCKPSCAASPTGTPTTGASMILKLAELNRRAA